jgi:hypothetical protein
MVQPQCLKQLKKKSQTVERAIGQKIGQCFSVVQQKDQTKRTTQHEKKAKTKRTKSCQS